MNNIEDMKKLMESVSPYQPLEEAPRHISSNDRYSPNTNIDINIPQSTPEKDEYAEFKKWLSSSPVGWDVLETMEDEVVVRFKV